MGKREKYVVSDYIKHNRQESFKGIEAAKMSSFIFGTYFEIPKPESNKFINRKGETNL
jgi:hypothetical protein